jgi:hypothetical protein
MAIVDINWHPTRRELRWFAGLLIVFCGIVAWTVSRGREDSTLPVAIVVTGAVLGFTGLALPGFIRYVYVVWMVAVSPIAFVVSNLIVAVVFYLVVAPIGFAMKVVGRDALHLERKRDARSYWVEKKMPKDARRYFRQY